MRKLINLSAITTLCVFIIAISCTHLQNESLLPELVSAESIMYQNPDSALMILEEMQMPSASNRLQHATWCLLLSHAKYKNYIHVQNDSLINIAYEYFMKQEDSQRKALGLYLKGALNEEWHEVEKAIQFYLDATKEVEKTKDFQLGHFIYVGLGNIYLYRELYEYAEEAFLKSHHYAELSGDNMYISNSLILIARVYASLENWDKSIHYFKEAIEAARKTNNAMSLSLALNDIAAVYTQTGEYALALESLQESIDEKTITESALANWYLSKGDIFRHLKQQDSAYFYVDKALLTNSIYTKSAAYQLLYQLSLDEKEYKKAIEYAHNYQLLADSIQKIDRSRTLIEMREKYNQEKIINEKNLLKIERDRTVRNLLITLIVLIMMIAVIIFIYQQKLIRKQRTIRQHQEDLKKYILRVYENELQIGQNENRINELTAEMEQNKDFQELLEEQQRAITEIRDQNDALNKENKALQKNISHYSTSLEEKLHELDTLKRLSEENKRLRNREKFLSTHLLEYIKELNTLRKKPKYLDVMQWTEIIRTVNWMYDNFAERIANEFPALTDEDIQLCCLIKLGIPVSNIATIVATLPTSVSKRKLRLKERLRNPFEGNQSLDVWIQNY